jgi:hypothetical protein
MIRTTRVLGFSVPPAVVEEVETLAREEHRTKSELFQEMVRVYRRYREQKDPDDTRWIMDLIEEARAEEAKNPMNVEEALAEEKRLARYGAEQTKKAGLQNKSVNLIIHEYRKEKRRA